LNQSRIKKKNATSLFSSDAQKRSSQLIDMCKPRELMFLADDLANNEGSFSKLEDVIIN
jgi:hypothetical protein